MSPVAVKNINNHFALFFSQVKQKLLIPDADITGIWDEWYATNKIESQKKSSGMETVLRDRVVAFYDEFGCVLSSEGVWDSLSESVYARMVAALWGEQRNQELLIESLKGLNKRKVARNDSGNVVKRNKSAYLFCCAHFRDGVKRDHPEMTPQQVTKILGEKWKEVSSEKGELFDKFTRLASEDKERYGKENPSTVVKKPVKPKSPARSPGKPRGKSAWVIFCEIKRADVKERLGDEATNKQIMHELGLMWASDEYTQVKIIAEEKSIESKEKVREQLRKEKADVEPDNNVILEESTVVAVEKVKERPAVATPIKENPVVVKHPGAPVKDNAKAKLKILLADDESELEEEDEDYDVNVNMSGMTFE
jgi:hypothetical protein